MDLIQKKSFKLILFALSVYFIFFTFFKLSWGSPFFFHPDERNIASSISQLRFPENLNPHFFAYGSLPIYLVYALGIISNFFSGRFFDNHVYFETAIIIGRIFSAFLTLGSVLLTFKIAKSIAGNNAGLLSLIFCFTSTAFFQFSHFGTFEIWLTFFSLLIIFLVLKFLEQKRTILIVFAGISLGILTTLKLSSVVFVLIPLFAIFSVSLSKKVKNKFSKLFKFTFLLFYFSFIFYILGAPFNIIDYKSFFSSMQYEGGVVMGTLPVFYTGSFYNSIPILFQLEKILPFLINPLNTVVFIPIFIGSVFYTIKNKDLRLAIVIFSFLIYFVSGSIFFAKWTRYLIPVIPLIYIIISVFLVKFLSKKILFPTAVFFTLIGVIFSFSFLKTTRLDTDTRLASLNYAVNNIPKESSIVSEVYDLGIVPYNETYGNISLFNFYDLDNGGSQIELSELLKNTDYIILPSQRIYKSRILHPENFPNANYFYKNLFNGDSGFEKVYETPCDIFCKLTYFGDPVFNVEETSNVFDRPKVYIFKNTNK